MEIGNKVRITNFGNTYTSYSQMFIRLGFKNPEENDIPWKRATFYKNQVFTIFNISKHPTLKTTLYAIRHENLELLMGEGGIKRICCRISNLKTI